MAARTVLLLPARGYDLVNRGQLLTLTQQPKDIWLVCTSDIVGAHEQVSRRPAAQVQKSRSHNQVHQKGELASITQTIKVARQDRDVERGMVEFQPTDQLLLTCKRNHAPPGPPCRFQARQQNARCTTSPACATNGRCAQQRTRNTAHNREQSQSSDQGTKQHSTFR